MLTAARESFMFFIDESDNLVQYTMFVNKLNLLLYAFSGITIAQKADTSAPSKSIQSAGK